MRYPSMNIDEIFREVEQVRKEKMNIGQLMRIVRSQKYSQIQSRSIDIQSLEAYVP